METLHPYRSLTTNRYRYRMEAQTNEKNRLKCLPKSAAW
jgi:hypothetical protein